MYNQPSPFPSFQSELRLNSGSRIWIVTDTFSYDNAFYPCSQRQEWYKVGAFDLETNCWGFFRFSLDDASAMLKAGLPSPPWTAPMAFGISVKRFAHTAGGKGRFSEVITLVDLEPELFAKGPMFRKKFKDNGHSPNSSPGMWQKMELRVNLDLLIDTTALAMIGEFSAGDVKKIVGKDVYVTRRLKRLVREERLIFWGKNRSAKYQVAEPVISERVDWAG